MLARALSMFLALLRWIIRQEIGVLIAVAVVATAAWLFLNVADEVVEREADPIDDRILLALRSAEDPSRPVGPSWLVVAAEEITALGSTTVLALLTTIVCLYLMIQRLARLAMFVLICVGGGTLLSTLLKLAFGRERPDVVPHLTHFGQASFPSGHAMLSTVAFLTLGVLLAEIEKRKRVKAYIMAVAVCLAALVGATRVYLGVHYPTDVAAGWTAGVAWAVGCWGVARWLKKRGELKGDQAARDDVSESRRTPATPAPHPLSQTPTP